MKKNHFPVLSNEVIEMFVTNLEGVYVDCTLGFGGHSNAILNKINDKGFLIGLDLDPYALDKAKEKLQKTKSKCFSLYHSSYKEFPKVLSELGIEKVDGFLFDLGISSYQIDSEHRGFSYINSGPLDMRFNPNHGITAKKFLEAVKEKDLIRIMQIYAEVSHAKKIARRIIQKRNERKMNTTEDLKNAIFYSLNGCNNKIVGRVFQAIRIAVNDEINTFKNTLELIPQYLNKGGKIAVISFHSMEDRIVKHFFKNNVIIDEEDYHNPKSLGNDFKFNILTKKPVQATKKELMANSRSKSAKFRLAELL